MIKDIEKHNTNNILSGKSRINNKTIHDEIFDILKNGCINDNAERIDNLIRILCKNIEKGDIRNTEYQKKIFYNLLNILNKIFPQNGINNFYNNFPKTKLQEYCKKSIGGEIIHNITHKNLLDSKLINQGGACYHRTIVLKKIFDKLEKAGLNITSYIFRYDGPHAHSAISLNFQGKTYIVDCFRLDTRNGDLSIGKEIIFTYDNNDYLSYTSYGSILLYTKDHIESIINQGNNDKDITYFKDIGDFRNFLEKIQNPQKLKIKYNEISDNDDSFLYISFYKGNYYNNFPNEHIISIKKINNRNRSQGTIYKFSINKEQKEKIVISKDDELLDTIIDNCSYIQTDGSSIISHSKGIEEKKFLKKSLLPIKNRINLDKLRKILQ